MQRKREGWGYPSVLYGMKEQALSLKIDSGL
jgi:hypothetical protein